ncbi:MAG: redoxin domain-containing protein [Deltaproteobacteria bacterium]|nr:redoxin domain-containing protein [Deltaproteobacteria bacterium]MBI2348228.1 redoxin domain-containing protein [Deltaproteobacteria bacterium]MBI2539384.1 redoxin domain-containing protein [Deltaproteobacteria bacterium]MBI2992026.1 redoxin domain-containing protein [Deltaproteobacteria bacterium]MBI3062623.1 redoxin domain-containing protein [Deltaproteobacteria bacterium]
MQLRLLTEFQKELAVNYCKLAVVSVDPPEVNAAFRAGLGADFPFLSDQDRAVVRQLDMIETSKSRGETAIPYAFSLMPDLTVHNLYCGYWYVGRPTLDELRQDLRAMMKKGRADFDPQAQSVRSGS